MTKTEARARVRAYREALTEGRVLVFKGQVNPALPSFSAPEQFVSYPTISHRDHALAEAKTAGISVRIARPLSTPEEKL